jgi:hypothetical protein
MLEQIEAELADVKMSAASANAPAWSADCSPGADTLPAVT